MSDEATIRAPGEGRAYELGAMRGVFKADGPETGERYCVSEWTLQPGGPGPGAHSHEREDEIFILTAGTMTFLVGGNWSTRSSARCCAARRERRTTSPITPARPRPRSTSSSPAASRSTSASGCPSPGQRLPWAG